MRAGLRVLAIMALQNLLLHRIKSLVVGGILFFGSLFLCLGLNLTLSVERSMAESIQGSVAGDFQIYDATAKDKLALFGGAFFGREELGTIPDWKTAAAAIENLPEVSAVVPMGFENGFIARGNAFDELFQKLREFARMETGSEPSLAHSEHIDLVRKNLEVLKADLQTELRISADQSETQASIDEVSEAQSEDFWQKYRAAVQTNPNELESLLLFLDTRIAPLSGEKTPIYLRYLGTDLDLFAKSFSRFSVVNGSLPPNTPGAPPSILLPERFYERELKNLVAVTFDRLAVGLREQKLNPATNTEMAALIQQLPEQYTQIVLALPPRERDALSPLLAQVLKADAATGFEKLMQQFLTVDATNVLERHDWFYANIAPRARLHDVTVGETLYLRAYTRTGYLKTVPLTVAGIYRFEGLQRSDLAGAISLISLESFRTLYGVMSAASKTELSDLAASVQVTGARDLSVSSESLEDALFGGESEKSDKQQEAKEQTGSAAQFREQASGTNLAINLAVILSDRSRAEQAAEALKRAIRTSGLNLQVVDWKSASGLIGQLVTALTVILFTAVFVILVVGIAIINNSLMMSTLERSREIGTLRAIGAQRSFIIALFLGEIVLLSAVAIFSGALLAYGISSYLHLKGIPATSDFSVFLFSGPRLYPFVSLWHNVVAGLILLTLAALSSTFPALFASRIEPAVAMQEKE